MKAVAVLSGLLAVTSVVAGGFTETFDNGETVEFPYAFGEMEWTGQLEEGGPEVTIAGESLEQIDAIAKAEHNGTSIFDDSVSFDDDFDEFTGTPTTTTEPLAARSALRRRDSPKCIKNYGSVLATSITEGVKHLRGVSRCRAKKRQCIRTTCNKQAAIVLCNDRYSDLDMSCATVADYAVSIRQKCFQFGPCQNVCSPGGCKMCTQGGKISGQRFSPDGWNVLVSHCNKYSSSGQPV
ncbi:hypothetical protein Micbo1qcDRAFT_179856 [Microdochium bolleyi]|uniref:Uncharacterized protein n=1 Tax=Microdochium bolleyi TaxID=196109 RepID=A0A136INU5_9PEZI|nr:hypothetical protein Micbo1qcDRAFT_179856 [Microdochium bolleyi]